MAAMTFVAMQNAVITDGPVQESRRSDVKVWLQDALTELWDAENYVFKSSVVAVTVVNGLLTQPADLADIFALYDPNGEPLVPYYDPRLFYDRYNPNIVQSGSAEAYCIVGNTTAVEPHVTGTVSGFQLAYKKLAKQLVNDGDTTGLPDGYDMACVWGAKAIGYSLINNPFADDFSSKFVAKKAQLKDAYLYGIDEVGDQVPAYRPYA